LHDIGAIRRVTVSTYQSVSGAGNDAMDELFTQTRAVFVNDELKRENFTKQIAFNVIPHIGDFNKDGTTTEEQKMIDETHKMLDPEIGVSVTCVRVPVFVGHSEAVNIEFSKPVSVAEARSALEDADGVLVVDRREDGGYVSPIECVGEYETFVSRIREDASLENGMNIWVVSDNLRKGAALNAVQIAELLVAKHLTKSRVA
jgi:aspartate-semialdehyde dehydrogenase